MPTTFVVDPTGSGNFTTIQAAVDAPNVMNGDTLLIDPATYTEQLTINKSLTLQGHGGTPIIQAPSTMVANAQGLFAVVEVSNAATVDMSSLTVQGTVPSSIPGGSGIAGILIDGGATADVTNSTIAHIRREPISGVGNTGQAILVGDPSGAGGIGTATISNDIITDYQKTGVMVRAGSSASITGNTITGSGPTSAIGQNGITIFPGATATITGNTISGNEFTGTNSGPDPFTNALAAGILNAADSTSITGNTISGNNMGVYSTNLATTAPGATIEGNTVEGSFVGIFIDQGFSTVSNNTITGNNVGVGILGLTSNAFFGTNTINAQGAIVDNIITDNGNGNLSFPGAGILVQNGSGAPHTGVLAEEHFNSITGNSVGLNNATPTQVDATNTWWGSNDGPGHNGANSVTGNVLFDPWLVLQLTASPTSVPPSGTATVVADMTKNSAGMDTSALDRLPDGIPVAFAATGGTITPAEAFIAAGKATAIFTAGTTPGTATVSATVDQQTVNTQEDIAVTAVHLFAVGSGPGQAPLVKVYNGDGTVRFSFDAYDPAFTGGVTVAVADVNGDGIDDIITGAGPGGGPHVKVFDGSTGAEIMSFFAYDPAFRGGVWVAGGDVNADGHADIVTGAGPGGGPHVKVFDGATGAVLDSFFAYTPAFAGGVRVAAGDVNGDGKADIITGAGPGGGPHVKVFDVSGNTPAVLDSYFAYPATFTGGVFVAAGDVNGDGHADIITGSGPGSDPRVKVFDGATLAVLQSFDAYDPAFTGGVRVAAGDVDGDGIDDIITGAGPGGGPHVKVFDGATLAVLHSFFAFDPTFAGGVFVG